MTRKLLLTSGESFSSFIDSHGQSLIDLSLYVSSENYRTTTLPAYTCILPWPEQWLIPSQHRATAKSRTAHLNFSSLDLDDHNSAESNRKSILEMIPTSLRSSRESVSSLVNLPQHASRFRLEALADDWLGPLHELLGEKLYLLSDQRPTSLDCLAFAYLALAVVPVVPQPWLKDSVIARYPKLAAYVNQLVALAFGGPTRANRAIMQSPPPPPPRSADTASGFGSNRNEGARSEGVLPWREPQPRGTYLTAMALFDSVFGSLPIIGAHYRNGIIILAPVQNESPEKMMHAKTKNDSSLPRQTILPAVLTVVGTTAVAMTAYFFYGGLSTFLATEPGPRKHRFSDFGEAGALLAMADLGSSTTRMSEVRDSGRRLGSGLAPVAEVAVGVDGVEEL